MSLIPIVLERLGVDPAIAGDLIEEYASGRSRAWLVWQAFAAAALATVRHIRHHKLLAARAIVVGLIAIYGVSGLVIAPLREAIQNTIEARGLAGPWLWFFFEPYVLHPILAMLSGVAAGWITGGLHRPYSVPLMAGLTVAVALLNWHEIARLFLNSLTNVRFVPYLCRQLSYVAEVGVGLVVGAAMNAAPPVYNKSGG
jgi:hypothetical protein